DSPAVARAPGRDHRVGELLQVGHRVRLVVAAPGIGVPTAVPARDEPVDLVVLVRAVLDAVRLPGPGSERDALRVAVAEGVDAIGAGLVHERVVGGRAAVRVETQPLAVEPVDVLGRGSDPAITGRHPQLAVRAEANPAAVVEVRLGPTTREDRYPVLAV